MSRGKKRPVSRSDILGLMGLECSAQDFIYISSLLGFELVDHSDDDKTALNVGLTKSFDTTLEQKLHNAREKREPLKLWYLKSYEFKNSEENQHEAEEINSLPETADKPQDIDGNDTPVFRSEFSPAQIQALLHNLLKTPFRHRLDIPKAVNIIARSQVVNRWPSKKSFQSKQEVVVLLDFQAHLFPVLEDYKEILASLRKLIGDQALELIVVPDDFYTDQEWLNALTAIPEQSHIIVLSDLGCYAGAYLQKQWHATLTQLNDKGHVLCGLLPTQANMQETLHHLTLMGGDREGQELINALTCAMAFCHLPTVNTLRYLRQQIPGATIADELAVWNHPAATVDSFQWSLKDQFHDKYLALFSSINLKLQTYIKDALKTLNNAAALETRGFNEGLMYEYGLIDRPPDYSLFRQLMVSQSSSSEQIHMTDSILKNAMKVLGKTKKLHALTQYDPLFERAQAINIASGKPLLRLLNPDHPDFQEQLYYIQQGNQLRVSKEEQKSGVVLKHKANLVESKSRVLVSAGQSFSASSLELEIGEVSITLARIEKPIWADKIGRDPSGLYCAKLWLNRWVKAYRSQSSTSNKNEPFACDWSNSDLGTDQYGLYADLAIKNTTQRFRWINPGTFLMGSPVSEEGRSTDEVQHQVTLTKGFWLADTTVTQALWQAVMDDNPSHFKGENLPVEQVSWEDCQKFIQTLNKMLPELNARFPTEAEWECACRAGTETAFSFGDAISPSLANFNESELGQTCEVSMYSPNPWGLYQMHGNVWEWCNDWYVGLYNDRAVDPAGAESGPWRVLRGGSWHNVGRGARSAYRFGLRPDSRFFNFGLRLALGHLSSGVEPSETKQARAEPRQVESGGGVIGSTKKKTQKTR